MSARGRYYCTLCLLLQEQVGVCVQCSLCGEGQGWLGSGGGVVVDTSDGHPFCDS